MIEEIQNVEEDRQNNLADDNEFRDAVYTQMRNIHNQGMVVGFQTACHTVLDNVYAFERKPGSKSANDYKRIIKSIKQFCETGISRKINANGEAETAENETVQN